MKLAGTLLCFLFAIPVLDAQAVPRRGVSNASDPKGSAATTTALENEISSLEKKVETLESTLRLHGYLLDQKQPTHSSIQLDPSDHTFQILDGDVSSFLVRVEDMTPYLNGYRVTMDIGNPTDATFSQVALKIKWAARYDFEHYSDDSYKKWQSSVQEKDVTLNTNLLPGSWNPITIDLVPCTAEQSGYMVLSMKTPSVMLNGGHRE